MCVYNQVYKPGVCFRIVWVCGYVHLFLYLLMCMNAHVHVCMCVCVCDCYRFIPNIMYHSPSPIKVVSFSLFTKNFWHLLCLNELDSCGDQSKAGPHNSKMEGIQGVG